MAPTREGIKGLTPAPLRTKVIGRTCHAQQLCRCSGRYLQVRRCSCSSPLSRRVVRTRSGMSDAPQQEPTIIWATRCNAPEHRVPRRPLLFYSGTGRLREPRPRSNCRNHPNRRNHTDHVKTPFGMFHIHIPSLLHVNSFVLTRFRSGEVWSQEVRAKTTRYNRSNIEIIL